MCRFARRDIHHYALGLASLVEEQMVLSSADSTHCILLVHVLKLPKEHSSFALHSFALERKKPNIGFC
jgi:hypothetical protein